MSYVITIKRPAGKIPLAALDFEGLIREDRSLSRTIGNQIVWFDSEEEEGFYINIDGDCLWTDGIGGDSTHHALAKLRNIAVRLDARVFGEEGEDITERSATGPIDAKQSTFGLVLYMASLPFLLLLLLVRLPWSLWKLWRALK